MQLHKRNKLNHQAAATIVGLKQRCVERAKDLRCPVHDRSPTVKLEGDRLEDVQIRVIACCPVFAESVLKTVRARL